MVLHYLVVVVVVLEFVVAEFVAILEKIFAAGYHSRLRSSLIKYLYIDRSVYLQGIFTLLLIPTININHSAQVHHRHSPSF